MSLAQRTDDWRSGGACLSADPDLFFPISWGGASAGQIAAAKSVCARCGVRSACLDFALSTGQQDGIWGGTTEEERRKAGRRASHASRRGLGRTAA